MASYVVELYVPRGSAEAVVAASARARMAAEKMTREGRPVRHLRAIFLPADETCFHLFEAASAEHVDEVGRRAFLTYERIVEAI